MLIRAISTVTTHYEHEHLQDAALAEHAKSQREAKQKLRKERKVLLKHKIKTLHRRRQSREAYLQENYLERNTKVHDKIDKIKSKIEKYEKVLEDADHKDDNLKSLHDQEKYLKGKPLIRGCTYDDTLWDRTEVVKKKILALSKEIDEEVLNE
jgi:hypothetical protein